MQNQQEEREDRMRKERIKKDRDIARLQNLQKPNEVFQAYQVEKIHKDLKIFLQNVYTSRNHLLVTRSNQYLVTSSNQLLKTTSGTISNYQLLIRLMKTQLL